VVVTVEDVRQTTAVHGGNYGGGKIPLILAERLWPWSRGKGGRPPERD
jgi:hypothetical protein